MVQINLVVSKIIPTFAVNNYNMDKVQLIEKIKLLGHLPQADRDRIIAWVTALPNTSNKVLPNEYKAGDVLMHPIFQHPYVLLRKQKDHWLCGLLTSEPTCEEILEQCNSRFFSTNYFTKVLFTVKEPIGPFMSPYENKTQLDGVYKSLKQILG